MKKKFFFGVALMAIAAGVFGFRMSSQPSDDALTPLQMKNLEVLTQSETGSGGPKTCYNTITSKEGCKVLYCPTCDYIPGTDTFYAPSDHCN